MKLYFYKRIESDDGIKALMQAAEAKETEKSYCCTEKETAKNCCGLAKNYDFPFIFVHTIKKDLIFPAVIDNHVVVSKEPLGLDDVIKYLCKPYELSIKNLEGRINLCRKSIGEIQSIKTIEIREN